MFEEEKSLFEKASADQDAVRVFIISWLVRGGNSVRGKKALLIRTLSGCVLLVGW